MPAFDLGIFASNAFVNQTLTTLFNKAGPTSSIFSGSQGITIAGVSATVGWQVQQAPQAALTAPTPQQWQSAISQSGGAPAPTPNAFSISFPKLLVSIQWTGSGPQQSVIPVLALATVAIAGNKLSLTPLGVIVDLSGVSPNDQAIYKAVIIPKVLAMAASFLSNQALPNIGFQGIAFGSPSIGVGDGFLGVAFNLQGSPTPPPPSTSGLPNLTFSMLLSPQAEQGLINAGVAGLRGRTVGTSGSQGFGIGSASYNASATVNQVNVAPLGGDLTMINAAVALGASAGANASISMPWPIPDITAGINYDCNPTPNPVGTYLRLSFSGTTLQVSVAHINGFGIILTPTGNIASEILSLIAYPLASIIANALVPLITNAVVGYSFNAFSVPNFPLQIGNVGLTISPSNLNLSTFGTALCVAGSINVS